MQNAQHDLHFCIIIVLTYGVMTLYVCVYKD